jgi:subtilase family serine protease
MKKLFMLSLLVSNVIFTGCVNVQMTPSDLDSDAKKFEPQSDKANIYINRIGQWFGYGFAFETSLDGRIVGSLAPKTYIMLSVSPGEHTIALSNVGNVTQQTVKVEPGKNYFFEASCIFGASNGQYDLKLISEDQGRDEVAKSKRSEAVSYQQ